VGKEIKVFLKISVVPEYPLALIAPRDDVVEGAFEFYPGFAWHDATLS